MASLSPSPWSRAMTTPLITLAPGAHLWLALYSHRHGTSSALVLSDRDPWYTVPEVALNEEEGVSAESWLCDIIFQETYEPEDDESLEFIAVDLPGGVVPLGAFATEEPWTVSTPVNPVAQT